MAVVRVRVSGRATAARASTQSRRNLMGAAGIAALSGLVAQTPAPARAGLVEELLEKSAANKEMNDKHRQRTFDANLARSRTVTDGTCQFPNNFIGCENYAESADVKFITDDIKGECANTADGKVCRSKVKRSFPSFLGL